MPLPIDPIRFDQGYALFDKRGLLVTKNFIDLSTAMTINSITMSVVEPSNTQIKLAFYINDTWKMWDGSQWASLSNQTISINSILDEGMTPTVVNTLTSTNMVALQEKKKKIAIAMQADELEPPFPTLTGFSINYTSDTIVYDKTIESTEFILALPEKDAVQISEITINKEEIESGTVTLSVKLDEDEEWSNYETVINESARKIKFKALLHAETPNTSIAKLNDIKIKTTAVEIEEKLVDDGIGVIYTKTYDFSSDLGTNGITGAGILIYRDYVKDTSIRAYISVRKPIVKVFNEILATGDGTTPLIVTPVHTNKILWHTLLVHWNGLLKIKDTDYSINESTNEISLYNVPNNVDVSIDYDYGYSYEEWEELEYVGYTVNPKNINERIEQFKILSLVNEGHVVAVKIELISPHATDYEEILGTGNGYQNTYSLRYPVLDQQIKIFSNDVEITDIYFNKETNKVTFETILNEQVKAIYTWKTDLAMIDHLSIAWYS